MNNLRLSTQLFTLLVAVSLLSTEWVNAVPTVVDTSASSCAQAFETAAGPAASTVQQTKEAAVVKAGEKFFKYFEVMRWNLKERDYVLDLIEQALIAEEGVLIMGPPGTAKSQVADTVLGGIIDEDKVKENQKEIERAKESENKKNRKSKKDKGQKTVAELEAEPVNSFFRLQLTAETTMSETHGPLNFKRLTEENIYDRKYEDSMLNFKNVFIDEIFDARPNALRNILGILGERAHSQGGRTRKAKLETFVAATNSYLSQVYEKAGNDGPKAVIDRFSFSSFVPGELEKTKSAVDIIVGAKKPSALKEIPRLTFQELDQIRDLVPDVDIPVHVASFLAVLSKQLKEETETLETASLKTYNNALRNGDAAAPPYRATKYHSPRSLGKAAGILKAWVVRDWLKQQLDSKIPNEKKRPLKATLEDVKALEQFFTLNGPSDEFVKKLIAHANNDHEKAQLEAIVRERAVFRERYEELLKPIHARYHDEVGKHVNEVLGAINPNANPKDKKDAAAKLALQWVSEVEPHLSKVDELSELDGNAIGTQMLSEALSQSGIGLVGETEWDRLTQSLIEKRPVVPEAPVAKPDLRERVETVTGFEFILEPHHPILGKAWEDPRGLFWSDQVDRYGERTVKELHADSAAEECLKLNVEPGKRAEVERQLAAREAQLKPLRAEFYKLELEQRTTQAGKHIREESKKFGTIGGCYLPSREELEQQAIDKGYAKPNSRYKDNIFSDSAKITWSSSGHPSQPNAAFDFYGKHGVVDFDQKSLYYSVRCVCSAAGR